MTAEQAKLFATMMSATTAEDNTTSNVDPERQFVLLDGAGEPLFSCLGNSADMEWLNGILASKKLNIKMVKKDPNYVPTVKVRTA